MAFSCWSRLQLCKLLAVQRIARKLQLQSAKQATSFVKVPVAKRGDCKQEFGKGFEQLSFLGRNLKFVESVFLVNVCSAKPARRCEPQPVLFLEDSFQRQSQIGVVAH